MVIEEFVLLHRFEIETWASSAEGENKHEVGTVVEVEHKGRKPAPLQQFYLEFYNQKQKSQAILIFS